VIADLDTGFGNAIDLAYGEASQAAQFTDLQGGTYYRRPANDEHEVPYRWARSTKEKFGTISNASDAAMES
jgi:hypothetical protein